MNLEELYHNTKSKAIIIINKEGQIIQSYNDSNYEKTEEFSAVTMIIVNMLDSFFTEVLGLEPLNEIIIKTNKLHFYITKYNTDNVLCVLSDNAINTSLISLSLKKINSPITL